MAQVYTAVQLNLASDAQTQAANILRAARALTTDAGILTQSGANFADPVFAGTALQYLNAFQANVFFQNIVPALNTWLDTPYNNGITYRQWLETMVSGPI